MLTAARLTSLILLAAKSVAYDFARQMKGAKQVSCSAFGAAIAKHM